MRYCLTLVYYGVPLEIRMYICNEINNKIFAVVKTKTMKAVKISPSKLFMHTVTVYMCCKFLYVNNYVVP